MIRPSRVLRAALAATLCLAAGCSGGAPTSLVLVTLDTTRVDHLSCYGYERETTPRLDALAARGVRFTRAWSTSAWTLPAHASLFTGLHPSAHGARFDTRGDAVLGSVIRMQGAHSVRASRLPESATTLAERLVARGYRTGAFVSGPWLHRSFGLLQGFETIDDDVTTFGGRRAEDTTDLAIHWLESLEGGRPFFLFVNYFDPHMPYDPPAGFDDLPHAREDFELPFGDLMAGRRTLTPEERAILRDRYDGEIRYMDHHLGRLLDAVVARPGTRPLIVVTADHGEALGEGGRYGHTYWLAEEALRVPLVVRYPDGRGAGTVDQAPVSLVDLLPLVARELAVELEAPVEGLLPGVRDVAFAELHRLASAVESFGEQYDRNLLAVIDWPHKLVRSDRGEWQLFELSPEGVRQKQLADPAAAARLAALLDDFASARPDVAPTPASVDPATHEALRRLGYLE